MAIEPNLNPESGAVLGDAWISYDEDTFRADAENQRKMSESAATGAAAVSTAGQETADTLRGGAGGALQDRLGEDTRALGVAGDRHAEAASHLDSAAISIEEAKAAMNAVDADYHTQVVAMTARATAEAWTPAETALARNDLLTQAQGMVANIRAGFDSAYEGVVNALNATSGVQAPKMAAGTVEIPPAGATNAQQMGQAAGSAAVDFASGLLSGISGQGAGAAGGAGTPGYGVMAPGYMGGMGAGYGMAPGMGAGYGMPGYGMGGYGAGTPATPLNQLGQVVGGIAQSVLNGQGGTAGVPGVGGQVGMSGQANLAGLAGQASISGQASLNGLLQQAGAQGGLGGAANAVAGLQTDLSSAKTPEDVEKAVADAAAKVSADPAVPAADGGEAVGEPTSSEAAAESNPDEVGGDSAAESAPEADAVDVATDSEAAEASGEPDTATESAPEKTDDGSIPSRPVSDSEAPVDPITRLQTDVNAAIDGAADSARQGVDGFADAARGATSTSVGFVTTGTDGTVTADTLGLQGPQHIDAIATETSASDLGTRDGAASQAAAPTPAASGSSAAPVAPPAAPMAAPTAPYGSGAPMMAPPAAAAPPAAPAPGGGASVGQGAPRHPLADTGRHLRGDDLVPSTHHTAAGGDVGNATAAAAGVAFLAMLRGPIAGAHTRLALLRTQQFTSNAVTASAIGVFEIGADTTYVLATAHGVSYLPHNGAVPSDTRLLTELVDDTFYGQWCGYVNPVTKLAAFAATDQAVGHLTYVLTTDGGVDLPGVEVVTQSLIDVQNLASSNLLAATSRSRRDIVLAADADLGVEVRDMAMRTHVLRGDQYLHVLGSASGALWINDVDRNAYLEEWLRVLTADALRAVEQGDPGHAWFAIAEYRRAALQLIPSN